MRSSGFSLLEILWVVVILSIVGLAVAVHPGSSVQAERLEAATVEAATALRFARSEALRTGQHHGARFTALQDRIRVYRLDTSGAPPVEQYTVYHPLEKRLYDVDLTALASASGVDLGPVQFQFGGSGVDLDSVAFSGSGVPVSPVDLSGLDIGRIDLVSGPHSKRIDLAPMTGRTTVQ